MFILGEMFTLNKKTYLFSKPVLCESVHLLHVGINHLKVTRKFTAPFTVIESRNFID